MHQCSFLFTAWTESGVNIAALSNISSFFFDIFITFRHDEAELGPLLCHFSQRSSKKSASSQSRANITMAVDDSVIDRVGKRLRCTWSRQTWSLEKSSQRMKILPNYIQSVGRSAIAPWRLTMILIMQFLENLSDRQTADAVRGRIDWKYALSLELEGTISQGFVVFIYGSVVTLDWLKLVYNIF